MAARILFPRANFSTDDLVGVYERLSPVLLPHLADRPLTLKRYPDDIYGEAFWEKDAPGFTPSWVQRFPVPRKHEHSAIHYVGISNKKTLRWAASIGCIEIHPFLHKYPFVESPTVIAFDLDPGEGMSLLDCGTVALEIQKWFSRYGLECYAKVSGSKGLQVYIPLNTPSSYSVTQPLARDVAEELQMRYPDKVVAEMVRADRKGKIFVDWSQNADHKTTVSVYSVRASHQHPYISMPVTWDELRNAISRKKRELLIFTPESAIARIDEHGDLFAPVLTHDQHIPDSVVRKLRLPAIPPPKPVRIPRYSHGVSSLPRSSAQGGRKLFVVHKRGDELELGLELREALHLFAFHGMPGTKQKAVLHPVNTARPMTYIRDESPQAGLVWDLGTYEIVEGSFAKGDVALFFSGERLRGEWTLVQGPAGWQMRSIGGRISERESDQGARSIPHRRSA